MTAINQKKLNKLFFNPILGFGFLLCGIFACNPSSEPQNSHEPSTAADHLVPRYFSLENYFSAEIERLSALNNPVRKTVVINGESESQTLHIPNWNHELDLFLEADINKAAWRDSYAIDSTENALVYEALEPDLKTRKIKIKKGPKGEVTQIEIENEVSNWIYRSKEWLNYVPDSVYEIRKQQDIRIVGTNEYHVKAFGKP